MDLGEEYHRGEVPFGNVNLDHLLKVVLASSPHHKVIIVPFPYHSLEVSH